MSARLSAYEEPNRLTRNRRSCPGGINSLSERYASRVIRFSLFLLTAPPQPRATTTAIRLVAAWVREWRSFNPPASTLRAVLKSLVMSRPARIRSSLVRLLLI